MRNDDDLQSVLDTISKLIALEVAEAEARLRVELFKLQSDESGFLKAELIALRDDLCNILRGGAKRDDLPMHLSDQHRRRTSAESKP